MPLRHEKLQFLCNATAVCSKLWDRDGSVGMFITTYSWNRMKIDGLGLPEYMSDVWGQTSGTVLSHRSRRQTPVMHFPQSMQRLRTGSHWKSEDIHSEITPGTHLEITWISHGKTVLPEVSWTRIIPPSLWSNAWRVMTFPVAVVLILMLRHCHRNFAQPSVPSWQRHKWRRLMKWPVVSLVRMWAPP